MKRMPVFFFGHGSPMRAITEDEVTSKWAEIGQSLKEEYEEIKGILMISAHWYTRGQYVQGQAQPRQIYDMYGFPKALYEVNYRPNGHQELTERVLDLMADHVRLNNDWGIDHGAWSVLVHMFPQADIPVVQLSVDAQASAEEIYSRAKALSVLRDEGYLIIGSGNIVHNLRRVVWDNDQGSKETQIFSDYIRDRVLAHDHSAVINYQQAPEAAYAVPTPDHYLPLIYAIATVTEEDQVTSFNDLANLASISMTSFSFRP